MAGIPLISTVLAAPAAAVPPMPLVAASWGANSHGQLGIAVTGNRDSPVQVCQVGQAYPCALQLGPVVQVAAGDDDLSAALLAGGTVVAWGNNATGAVGDGTTTDRLAPTRVCAVGESAPCTAFLTGVQSIAAGRSHMLALLSDGSVVAWGNNEKGQLGDGTRTNRSTPVRVCAVHFAPRPCTSFLTGARQLVGGDDHSLALLTDGTVAAFGDNDYGQLGVDYRDYQLNPMLVCGADPPDCSSLLTGVTSLGPGVRDNSLAVGPDGVVFAWGNNFFGQLGDGTTTYRRTPVRACAVGEVAPCTTFLTGITGVAGGSFSHSIAVDANGAVYTWGANGSGQLGDGTTTARSTPVRTCALNQNSPCVQYLTGASQISAGRFHSVALLATTEVVTWGFGGNGELGNSATAGRTTPTKVCRDIMQIGQCVAVTGVRSVVAGGSHNLAVTDPPPE